MQESSSDDEPYKSENIDSDDDGTSDEEDVSITAIWAQAVAYKAANISEK